MTIDGSTEPTSTPGRILVVCTGNICRSPYVEHLLRDGLDHAWGPGRIVVRSAGLRGLVGEPMFPPAAAQLQARGLHAGGFRARRLEATEVKTADLILTVTREHRAAVLRMEPTALRRTVTPAEVALAAASISPAAPATTDLSRHLRQAAATVVACRPQTSSVPPADLDIDDPYGRPDEAYAVMAEQVGRALPRLLAALSPGAPVQEG
ncbi:MAG: low molecular weight phosphatase family protein [Ornithinimicrobium sp.]